MDTDAVIIGGGVAGISCALEMARLGIQSVVLERAPFLGGHAALFPCKATDSCQRCGACLLVDLHVRLASEEQAVCLPRTAVQDITCENDRFTLMVAQRPQRVHPDHCDHCGNCLEACPEPGAIIASPRDGKLSINDDVCLYFRDGSCKQCAQACYAHAIDLSTADRSMSVSGRAVVLATGFRTFDPHDAPRFGYGRIPGVVSAKELDEALQQGNFSPPRPNGQTSSVAFIQCVGSRDLRTGHDYCSQVCCGYAMRLARLLKHRFPGTEPTMFYMDLQTFDRDFENRLREAAREVRLVRSIPAAVLQGEDGRPILAYQDVDDNRATEGFDLVVLSVGISPDPEVEPLARVLGLQPTRDGFVSAPGDGNRRGIFAAGAVQGPRTIAESAMDGVRSACRVADYLRSPNQRDHA
jgi:heterodisulfide reductase subunit A